MGCRARSGKSYEPQSFPPKPHVPAGKQAGTATAEGIEGKSIKGSEPPGKSCLTDQLMRTKYLSLEISFTCKLT